MATNILVDGQFTQGNDIGIGFSGITPWNDWTNAGITVIAPHPPAIPGNYASLPTVADLFQRFSALPNGNYVLTFDVYNEAPNPAHLVFGVQPAGGGPYTEFSLGLMTEISLGPNSGWIPETLYFTVNNPGYTINELTFSNSYDAPFPPIANSINPPGTIIDVGNVFLGAVTNTAPAPTPGAGLFSLAFLLLLGLTAFWKHARKPA
jgi:hypothetical protein